MPIQYTSATMYGKILDRAVDTIEIDDHTITLVKLAEEVIDAIGSGSPSGSFPGFLAKDYVSGNPADDASPGLSALISAIQLGAGPTGVHGGLVWFGEGEYRLTETLDLTRFTGMFFGVGPGISPYHLSTPGHGTVFIWDGPANQPMFRINNSRDVLFSQFRMEGNDTSPPSAALEMLSISGDGAGTNAQLVFRDLVLGKYPWSTQGTNKGAIKSGFVWSGDNTNNDQFRIENVNIDSPLEYGLHLPNSQSIGGSTYGVVVSNAGIAGIATAASIDMFAPQFYGCPLAIKIIGSQTVVTVYSVHSEGGDTLAQTWASGFLTFIGGSVQVRETITGSGVLIDAFPADTLHLTMHKLKLTDNTDPSKAMIEIGPGDGWPGSFNLDIDDVQDVHPRQVVMPAGASMWATNPRSRGTVQFHSNYGAKTYQFRNELAKSGAGTRSTLNYNVWDPPLIEIVYTGVLDYTPGMTYADAITMIPNLLGYWKLNETSGTTAADSSGNGRDATISGGTLLNQTGLLTGNTDKAMTFDGVDDKAITAALAAFNLSGVAPFSMGFIYKTTSLPASDDTFIGTSLCYIYAGATGKFNAARTGTGAVSATTIAINTTYRVVMTFDGSMIRLYINGVMDGSLADLNSMASANRAFAIGGFATGSYYAPGTHDEVFVTSTVLNQSDIDLLERVATGG